MHMTHCSESSGLSVCAIITARPALRTTAGRLAVTWRVYLATLEYWMLLGAGHTLPGNLCVSSQHRHTHTHTRGSQHTLQ